MTATIPLGVRINNPLNMRSNTRDKWQGLAAPPSVEGFFSYLTPPDGFRAATVSMVHAFDFDKAADGSPINTIAKLVTHWAPPSENDTAAYIKHVCDLTGRAADLVLDFHDWNTIRPIEKAMCVHEQGAWLFEDTDLDTGLRRAGIKEPVPALTQSRTLKAAIGSSAVAIPAVVDAIQQIKPAIDTVAAIKEYLPSVALVICLVAAAVITYARVDDWLHSKR